MRTITSLTLAMIVLAGDGSAAIAQAQRHPAPSTPSVAVAPQYDTTHVYVAPQDFDRFVASLIATFGGKGSPQGVFQVTPTPSQTMSQLVFLPVGTVSVFGFKTPIPYPFGTERTGYLVTNMDVAIRAAQSAGADVIVAPFPDPVGRDAVIQWPGGVNMQLYWHTKAPDYATLQTIPENRVYVSPLRADAFIHDFLQFSHGRVVSDDRRAPGADIGRPQETFRRVRLVSQFGKVAVLVTDGHLPFPYGREVTGYQVADLGQTLEKAKAAGANVLVPTYPVGPDRRAAIVEFPGGYIAEIHAPMR